MQLDPSGAGASPHRPGCLLEAPRGHHSGSGRGRRWNSSTVEDETILRQFPPLRCLEETLRSGRVTLPTPPRVERSRRVDRDRALLSSNIPRLRRSFPTGLCSSERSARISKRSILSLVGGCSSRGRIAARHLFLNPVHEFTQDLGTYRVAGFYVSGHETGTASTAPSRRVGSPLIPASL